MPGVRPGGLSPLTSAPRAASSVPAWARPPRTSARACASRRAGPEAPRLPRARSPVGPASPRDTRAGAGLRVVTPARRSARPRLPGRRSRPETRPPACSSGGHRDREPVAQERGGLRSVARELRHDLFLHVQVHPALVAAQVDVRDPVAIALHPLLADVEPVLRGSEDRAPERAELREGRLLAPGRPVLLAAVPVRLRHPDPALGRIAVRRHREQVDREGQERKAQAHPRGHHQRQVGWLRQADEVRVGDRVVALARVGDHPIDDPLREEVAVLALAEPEVVGRERQHVRAPVREVRAEHEQVHAPVAVGLRQPPRLPKVSGWSGGLPAASSRRSASQGVNAGTSPEPGSSAPVQRPK